MTTLRALNKCLDVAGTGNGALVRLWTLNGSGAQNWTAGANGSLVNPSALTPTEAVPPTAPN